MRWHFLTPVWSSVNRWKASSDLLMRVLGYLADAVVLHLDEVANLGGVDTYGESLLRVLSLALLAVLGATGPYWQFDLIEYRSSPSETTLLAAMGVSLPEQAVSFLDALYFGTPRFSTLGMGPFQPTSPGGSSSRWRRSRASLA